MIKYKMEGMEVYGTIINSYITKCPFGQTGNVGSMWCQNCDSFTSKNEREQTVHCKLEKETNK